MINPDGARAYRTRCEAEARAAAASGDREVWLHAIGQVTALDYALCDEEDLPVAGVRIPFEGRFGGEQSMSAPGQTHDQGQTG